MVPHRHSHGDIMIHQIVKKVDLCFDRWFGMPPVRVDFQDVACIRSVYAVYIADTLPEEAAADRLLKGVAKSRPAGKSMLSQDRMRHRKMLFHRFTTVIQNPILGLSLMLDMYFVTSDIFAMLPVSHPDLCLSVHPEWIQLYHLSLPAFTRQNLSPGLVNHMPDSSPNTLNWLS